MNYGFALSAGGALASMHRLDVAANNLANATTVAFKPDIVLTRARDPERFSGSVAGIAPKSMLERLGGGVTIDPTHPDLRQGAIKTTSRDLDVALDGNGFLAVRDRTGQVVLTRDGRLEIDAQGRLVMASGGRAVLDQSGATIHVDRNKGVAILEDGSIQQDGQELGRLAVVDAPAAQLRKLGDGLYTRIGVATTGGDKSRRLAGLEAGNAKVVQSAVEESGVDPVTQLVTVMKATRAFEAGTTLIKQQDQTLQRSIEVFGKFA